MPQQVTIRVDDDDSAHKISAVLEALGFEVTRELATGVAPSHLLDAADRLRRRHMLTTREHEILVLMLQGSRHTTIAKELEISRATVKWHMHNVFAKTVTGNSEDLLRVALQLGRKS